MKVLIILLLIASFAGFVWGGWIFIQTISMTPLQFPVSNFVYEVIAAVFLMSLWIPALGISIDKKEKTKEKSK